MDASGEIGVGPLREWSFFLEILLVVCVVQRLVYFLEPLIRGGEGLPSTTLVELRPSKQVVCIYEIGALEASSGR